MSETPIIRCTVCGDEYPLEGVTFHDLREAGYRPRKVHGKIAVAGLCPLHGGRDHE